MIGARFVSQTVSGWLFALDPDDATPDDVMLAEIVARLLSAGLDQVNLVATLRDHAAAGERLRLSRDLHDGLLQSLSGLAFHAQTARQLVETNPAAAEERLGVVVELLAERQQALRDFVDELRPELAMRRQSLRARLEQIAKTIAFDRGVPIDVQTSDDIERVDAVLAGHIASFVAEALANAAKHAEPKSIRARISLEEKVVRIDVEDDGRGFPFHGRYDLERLVAEQRGPWSLKERVASLGGELVIDSSDRGSRVEVRLPLAS